MNLRTLALSLLAVVAAGRMTHAALEISSINSPTVITFEATIADVNNGAFIGTGFQPSPSPGQLDSDSWAITNNDGNLAFGGTQTSGTFARGLSNTAVSDRGIWSFDTDNNGTLGDNHAFGVQPTTAQSVFNPGTITLRVLNNTGGTASLWSIGYDVFAFNDQDRSNTVDFSYSTNDSTYITVPAVVFVSPQDADASPQWAMDSKATTIAANVANGSNLYLRWTISFTGGGSSSQYDQIALDNISIAAVPEASAILFGGIVCIACGLAAGLRRVTGSRVQCDAV